MENIMMLPASYCVMNEEEMTYTAGGATMVQALCAWVVPFYGWYKGITAVRDYRKAHPDNWTETGLDALSKDMEKSTANMLYDLGCSLSVVGSCLSIVWLPINALVVLTDKPGDSKEQQRRRLFPQGRAAALFLF